jgi:hypothetical protein
MNCDEFLPAIETGRVFARFKAQRHASRCPRCAAAYARLNEVKRQWSTAAPLSPCERHLWASAAAATETEPAASSRLGRVAWAGGLAAAGACVVAFFVVRSMRSDVTGPQHSQTPSPVISKVEPIVSEVTVTELVPAREFDALSDAVDQLDADLAKLRRETERLAARQKVAMTLERFGKW